MKKLSKTGITLNGNIPIENVVEEIENTPSPETTEEFKKQYYLYKSPRTGKIKCKERNGPIMNRRFEVNKANISNNVIRAIQEKNFINLIVSILAGSKEPLSIARILSEVEDIQNKFTFEKMKEMKNFEAKKEINVNSHKLRNAITKIKRSKLKPHLIIDKKRTGSTYLLDINFIENNAFNTIIEIANDVSKRQYNYKKKKVPDEKLDVLASLRKEKPSEDQVLDDIIEKTVRVKVEVTFKFNVE